MMNSSSNNQDINLYSGTEVRGKWHHHVYKVVRKLGAGASGTVYLVHSATGLVALKIGTDNMSITSEVNVLKHFSKVQGQILGPSLFDVDDTIINGRTYPFYTMEYLNGKEFISFMQGLGSEWLGILMIQLLNDLHRLHLAGWVFGDLKPDNLLVVGPPSRIRLLDVGGTTLLGRSIKEYTEFFDRGYWGIGTRKAEPSYDLFAVAMIMMNCGYPKRFAKGDGDSLQLLKKRVDDHPLLYPYRHVLFKAFEGKVTNALMMKEELIKVVSKGETLERKKVHRQPTAKSNKSKKKTMNRKIKKEKKPSYFTEVFLLASFLLLLYILYLFGQMM